MMRVFCGYKNEISILFTERMNALTLLGLPAKVLLAIALADPAVFVGLARSCRSLRELLNEPTIQAEALRLFTRTIGVPGGHCDVLPNGWKHGLETLTETISHYLMDKLHGVQYSYYSDSTHPRYVTNWMDGYKHGVETEYSYIGHVINETMWVDGVKHGMSTSWYESGQLMMESYYDVDKLHGTQICYEDDGSLFQSTDWFEGVRHGVDLYVEFNCLVIAPYVSGEINGVQTSYYPDGTLRYVLAKKNGVQHGLSVSYGLNGLIQYIKDFDEGKLHGMWISCRDNEHIAIASEWVDDVKHGWDIMYTRDGRKQVCRWDNGKRVSEEDLPDAKRRG